MLDQVAAHQVVLPDLSYYPPYHHQHSDNAPQYHITSANPEDSSLLSDSAARPRASYLLHGDNLSSIVSATLSPDSKDRPSSLDPDQAPSQEEREQRERERREEYEREDAIDRRTPSHSPNTVTLSPPLSSPASAHSQPYHPHPHYDNTHPSHPFSDDTAGHNGTTSMYEPQLPPHARATQPPSLPSIFTGINPHVPTSGPYSASPLSSPTDPEYQPSYSIRTAYPRYGFASSSLAGSALDRRMSEPAIRSMYQQQHAASLSSTLVTLPPPSNANAYSPSPSTASTVVPVTPHSPRPGSSHYNNTPSSLGYGHQRVGSGSSSGGGPPSWMSLKVPTPDELLPHGDLDSPLYGRHPEDALENIDLKSVSPTMGREGLHDSDDGEEKDREDDGKNGERKDGAGGDRKDKKTYSFVSLPGNAVKKRPRRRYDEIERLYQCNYPNCTKAYGTLNHLNAHVTMQKHGSKRSPGEFKELRKQWRQAKKEAEEADRERERNEMARAQAQAHNAHPHAGHPHLSPHSSHHLAHHLPPSHLSHLSSPHSHQLAYPPTMGHLAMLQQQQQQQISQHPLLMGRHSVGDNGLMSVPAVPTNSYNQLGSPQNPLSQYSPYLREGNTFPRPSEAFAPREIYNREGYSPYTVGRSPADMYPGSGGAVRPPRRRVSVPHAPYPDPHGSTFGYGALESQAPRYNNGTQVEENRDGLEMYRSQAHQSDTNNSSQPGWSPHQPPAQHHPTHTPQLPSSNSSHTPEQAHQPDDEPLLTNHVSLGSNRLPPDSTLLTPLPGYEPETEHGAGWSAGTGGDF